MTPAIATATSTEDNFDLAALDARLARSIFAGKLHHFPEIASTNTHALRQAESGAPDGSVYVADMQTGGRGRGTHTWVSPAGSGLYVSVLLRPRLAPQDALWLSLAAGLAVRAAVLEVCGLAADLRWPNDLLFGSRKFGGMLIELQAEITRVRHVVIGIGINVHQRSFAPELESQATSLALESGKDFPRQRLLLALLTSLASELDHLHTEPSARSSILTRLQEQSSWVRHKRVHVDEDGGYDGVTAGLDAQGFLLVETAGGLRTVRSGGVRAQEA